MITDEPSAMLRAAFVAVYRPYVARRAESFGVDIPDGVLETGEQWLDAALADLLSKPFDSQQRSPLEVFQEAMRWPNEELARRGVARPERDAAVERSLPLDWYGLAPASSQELGSGVWEAHLAWGAAKARALTPASVTAEESEAAPAAQRHSPAIGLLSTNLMDRSKIEPVVTSRGLEVAVWRRLTDVDTAGVVLALVDLEHTASDDAIRHLVAAGLDTIAFGPHVDDLAMARAGALGARQVLARSRFFRVLDELIPHVT